MDKGYSDYENHEIPNDSFELINKKLDKILQYHQDKLENTRLKVELGQLNVKIDTETIKLHKLSAKLDSMQHFLFLIKEYTELYKDGTIEDYRGHLTHIHNISETALLNLTILEDKHAK